MATSHQPTTLSPAAANGGCPGKNREQENKSIKAHTVPASVTQLTINLLA